MESERLERSEQTTLRRWIRYKENSKARAYLIAKGYRPFLYFEDHMWCGFIVRYHPYSRQEQVMLGGTIRHAARKMYAEGYWSKDQIIKEERQSL